MKKILALGIILLLLPLSNVWAEQCRADANCDGNVNLGDLVIMKGEFLSTGCDLCFPPTAVFKTGQTSCYDELGNVIDCAGTGQDGEYQMGYDRFTDNGNGTVTDTSTGLIWLKDANCIATHYPSFAQDGNVTWQHALNFVKGINDGTYSLCAASQHDWRLPNVAELRSISGPVAITGGRFTHLHEYSVPWSATTVLSFPDNAWYIELWTGMPFWLPKSYTLTVWPVRGGN